MWVTRRLLPWHTLDPGEREAILLAQELQADLLLMDDRQGRQEAQRRALTVTGTLEVLERAAERGWLDLPSALTRLQATNFYLPALLVRDLLARDAARKKQP
jgi:predicted nucleic acid-binding protein